MASSAIWGSWEDNRTMREVKAENQYKRYNKLAILEDIRIDRTSFELLRLFFQSSPEKIWRNNRNH